MRPAKKKYLPLARDGGSVRILAIRSSHRSRSRLKLDLEYIDLNDLDSAPFTFYEALSYTWGDVCDTVPCELNGLGHRITRNLASVLRILRGRTARRYLWVDALCINQEDVTERGHQVGLMRRIYSQAEQVLVWLGNEAAYTNDVIEKLEWIAMLEPHKEHLLPESLDSPADLESWRNVARFFDHPWFRRVWIRQEVALAKSIVVMCGNHLIYWQLLHRACEHLNDSAVRFNEIVTHVTDRGSGQISTFLMETFRQQLLDGLQPDLEILLLHARGADVTDPRDRVYGMLGLAGPKGVGIKIDYTFTKEEIFKDAMVNVLQGDGTLDALSGCQWSDSQNKALPSWVINLDEDWKEMVLRLRDDSKGLYGASGNSQANFTISDDHAELTVEGYVLDTVSATSPVFDDAAKLEEILNTFIQTIRASDSRQVTEPHSEKDFLARFIRILIADQNDESERATSEFLTDHATHETMDAFIKSLSYRYEYNPDLYELRVSEVCTSRRGVVTKRGRVGLAGSYVAPLDAVCIFLGAGVPFILRPKGNGAYTLIGEAYIDGVMDGKVYEELSAAGRMTTSFAIV